ncbi:MAG TPA: phosphoethanolamine--lipid A transferase [Cellvibrio sp.]|nr:phosphoethanolamine--lipid A transferase [Cellvibrio sp.]
MQSPISSPTTNLTASPAVSQIPADRNLSLHPTGVSLAIALFFVLFDNASFFTAIQQTFIKPHLANLVFLLSLGLLLWLLTFIFVSLLMLPRIGKPLISMLLITAACTAYFMDTYGIVIHRLMIQNLMETDTAEVHNLLNIHLLYYIVFLGIAPSFLLAKVSIGFSSIKTEIATRLIAIGVALGICLALVFSMSADYASFFRNHKNIRQMANPLNVIYAGISYIGSNKNPVEILPIENDAAVKSWAKAQGKPTLFILVVGETARSDHFSINGYTRETTPLLAQQDIINFPQVTSCGTETAVSVPCMFSVLGHNNYSDRKAKSQQGLLDVVHHAGIPVLWRDNNSNCKGACDRVDYEDMRQLQVPELCNDRECFDAVLLHNLDEKVNASRGSKMIVLHQKGSHGPDYFNRYPPSMERFSPLCKSNQLQHCTTQEVVNAFDNTIAYTDYFLNSTIEWLKTKSREYNTSLVYLSDHGESLGENHLYLHGMPYTIAPKTQKQVPFLFWFSEDFKRANKIDGNCLKKRQNQNFSHDNLFHTVLGLLNISTRIYSEDLDIVKPCRQDS